MKIIAMMILETFNVLSSVFFFEQLESQVNLRLQSN